MSAPQFDTAAFEAGLALQSDRELIEFVGLEADGFVPEAEELARAELERRGVQREALDQEVLRLKADRYDQERRGGGSTGKPLGRLGWWFCFLESGSFALIVILILSLSRRSRAAWQGLGAFGYGLGAKLVALMIFGAIVELTRR